MTRVEIDLVENGNIKNLVKEEKKKEGIQYFNEDESLKGSETRKSRGGKLTTS